MVEVFDRALGGFFVKLLSLSMHDDLSRGEGHLHRQSESGGVIVCTPVSV